MQHRSSRRFTRSARLVAVVALLGGALAGLAASHQTFAAGLSLTPTATSTSTPAAATGGRMLYAWGANEYGELGDGTATNRHTPVAVTLPGGAHATAITGGDGHSLALGSDGTLYAWGYNDHGQLGDGTTADRHTPVTVTLPGGVRATAIVAGGGHSLALDGDGHLYAWGYNREGELDDGTTTDRHTPVAVTLPGDVHATAIAAGSDDSLALGSDGTLYSWGYNSVGELGDGTTADRHTPGPVTLPSGVHATAIAAGYFHSLALGSDGRLYACGRDYQGELGNGAFIKRSTPVAVMLPGGARVTAIAAGDGDSLALVAPLTDTATSTPVPPTVTTTSTPVPPTATVHPMPHPGPPFTLSIAVARDPLTRGSVVAVGLRGGAHWRVDVSLTLSVRRVAAVASPRRPAGHGRHPATTLQLVVLYRQAAHLLLDARGQGRVALRLGYTPRAPLTATLTVGAHVASRSVTVSRVVRLVPPPPWL